MDELQVAPNTTPNVVMDGLHPNLLGFVLHLAALHALLFGFKLTITSAKDGTHVPNSLHAQGRAVDLRTNDKSEPQIDLLLHILSYATAGVKIATFDERNIQGGSHIHVEYHGE
jgi:hypothetical protein